MIVHIASAETAKRLRTVKQADDVVIAFSDNLLFGPCATDVVRHVEARRHDNRGMPLYPRNLRSMYTRLAGSLVPEADVILWSSGSLQHTVLSWMICAFSRARRVAIAQPTVSDRGRPQLNDQFGCMDREIKPGEIRALLGRETQLGSGARRAAVENWRSFTGRSPMEFNKHCLSKAVQELRRMRQYHASFFPRSKHGGLHMSLFDELLLTCAGTSWSLPSAILMRRSSEGTRLGPWLTCAGDVSVARRLREWARHSASDPVLESEPAEGGHLFRGVRYRLSARGENLLRRGLCSISDAPVCLIGGGSAYDPTHPVVAVEAEGWKLTQL